MKKSSYSTKILATISFFIIIANTILAQLAGSIVSSFANTSAMPYGDSTRFNGTHFGLVNDLFLQSNGEMVVVGYFTQYNGRNCGPLIRLKQNGVMDTAFAAGISFTGGQTGLNRIIQQSDGKYVICGNFNTCYGYPRFGIVRLNNDGSLDTTFTTPATSGFSGGLLGNNGNIFSLSVDSNNRYIVAGTFLYYNNSLVKYIIRFNTDGSVDYTFNTFSGFNYPIYSVAIQQDGKLLVGGEFTTFNFTNSCNHICRINYNGSLDTSFHIGSGFDNNVWKLSLQPDQKIICGGEFITYQSQTAKTIIRLDTNGRIDSSFHVASSGFTKNGQTSGIYDILVRQNGDIIVRGDFDHYGQDSALKIIALLPDGSSNPFYDFRNAFRMFSNGNNFESYAYRSNLFEAGNGDILVCNIDSIYNNTIRDQIILLHPNGYINENYYNVKTGFSDDARFKMIRQNDGKIICYGNFTQYNGYLCNYILRIFDDGSVDTSFHVGKGYFEPVDYKQVNAVTLQPDDKIIIGGDFNSSIIGQNILLRLLPNGEIDTTFHSLYKFASNTGDEIREIKLQPDGKVLIAGGILTYGNILTRHLVRLNSNGDLDTTFHVPNISTGLLAMTLQNDGKIVVAGPFDFHRFNTDGTTDTTFNAYQLVNFGINTLVMSGNKVLVGGRFNYTFGSTYNGIMQLNSDGSVDTAFSNRAATALIGVDLQVIIVQFDGKIIASGLINSVPNSMAGIFRFNVDGTIDSVFKSGVGINFQLSTGYYASGAVLLPNQKLLVGGYFHSFDGFYMNGILMLNCDHSLGIENNFKEPAYTIFPNPVYDKITIIGRKDLAGKRKLEIYDINGKIIKSATFISSTLTIDAPVISGIYFLRLTELNSTFSSKIIVQ